MTGVTVPVSGGARIRTQALLPQPLLPVLSLDPSLPSLKSWVLGRGGGGCQASGARVWGPGRLPFESQFPTHRIIIPVRRKHLLIGDPVIMPQRCEFEKK